MIYGAGAQAQIVLDIILKSHLYSVQGFVSNIIRYKDEKVWTYPILGKDDIIPNLIEKGIRHAIIAVGDNMIRATEYQKFLDAGFEMVQAIDPTTNISSHASIGNGTVVCLGAIISTQARVGENCIINTGATVDHHNIIGNHAHIGPGVNLGGRVTIGDNVLVGIGSTVIHNITIGQSSIIGAGSVVISDIPSGVVAVGIPCRPIRKISMEEEFAIQQAQITNQNNKKT